MFYGLTAKELYIILLLYYQAGGGLDEFLYYIWNSRFLHKIAKKHHLENLLYMVGKEQAALFHETEGETVFKAPHAYDVIYAKGELVQSGFVTLNHILLSLKAEHCLNPPFRKRRTSQNISAASRLFAF